MQLNAAHFTLATIGLYMFGTTVQQIALAVWAVASVYLINKGGRNNGIFQIVTQSGLRLILLGTIIAAVVASYGEPAQALFTSAAVNFVLVLSAAVGANYISHANMALRDFPNKSDGPEKLPSWLSGLKKSDKEK